MIISKKFYGAQNDRRQGGEMSDDSKSDGPYKAEHWEGHNEFVVVGPGWENLGGTYTKNEARIAYRFANMAYAEGRKAAEKDFQELLEMANEAGYFNQDIMSWRMKYADWKKARGIE